MDHLPLPRSVSAPLKVPCLSTGNYDSGPFSSFPARQNWEIKLFYLSFEESVSCDGRIPSFEETEAFLQTWLYFGTIHEIFGGDLNLSDFIATDDGGNRFLCTVNLRKVMNDWLGRSYSAADPEDMQHRALLSLYNHVRSHLHDKLYTILSGFSGVREIVETGTVAAAAALGESLEKFVTEHATFRRILTTETANPNCILWGPRFSKWITNHMNSSGWCPSTITRLSMEEHPSISELYYYCHLPAPQRAKDHSSCSPDSCLALQIDPTTYRTVHTTVSCECPELALDVEKIGETLRNGRLPLIQISPDGEPAHANIICTEDDGNAGFVAISHVWAGGLGNVSNNALPACSLQEISRLVSELPRGSLQQSELVPFWIDTVCVPVEPYNLKQLALSYLRHPYMNAKHVLVLDEYLRTVNAEDCDELEIFARLSCGNWIGRLWTLQEGQLSKRIWFQFRDKAVELKALWETFIKCPRSRGSDYWHLLVRIAVKWNAKVTDVFGGRDREIGIERSIPYFLRSAMWFRSVSVPADEALCLFCLAGLDMVTITSVHPSAPLRMRTFWSQMQSVPSGLLFSKCPQKLDERGFRWAPLTFMGGLPRGHWLGPSLKLEDDSGGTPTPRGLLAKFPGYICNVTWDELKDWRELFFCSGGSWLRLLLDKPWHPQTSPCVPPNGPQRMAVILVDSLHDCAVQYSLDSSQNHISAGDDSDGVKAKPNWGDSSEGVIGFLTDEGAGTKYVNVLCHVLVEVLKPTEQLIYSAALNCISSQLPHAGRLHNLDIQQVYRMTKACFDEHPAISSACQTWALGSYGTGQGRFAALLAAMITRTRYGGIAAEVPGEQCWCVD